MIEPRPPRNRAGATRPTKGMVCENLHSVRFTAPAVYEDFLAHFIAFAERASSAGLRIEFRPHPAGRWILDEVGVASRAQNFMAERVWEVRVKIARPRTRFAGRYGD